MYILHTFSFKIGHIKKRELRQKKERKFDKSQLWEDKPLEQLLSLTDSSQAWHISAISNYQDDIYSHLELFVLIIFGFLLIDLTLLLIDF